MNKHHFDIMLLSCLLLILSLFGNHVSGRFFLDNRRHLTNVDVCFCTPVIIKTSNAVVELNSQTILTI